MPTKIAVVTGASGGIGSEVCKQIALQGVHLVLVDRKVQSSQALAAELDRLHPGVVQDSFAVDLSSHADIKRATSEILAKHPRIDYLFNNAGVLTETLRFSGQGNELHFEVNTLAPLQMIDGLRPALRSAGGAFVVNTTAGLANRVKELDWEDLIKPKEFSKLFGPYAKSKQALNVLTAALAPELAEDGITIRASDPGPTKTALTKGGGTPLWMRVFAFALPTPDKSARKIFGAAFSPKWGDKSGVFISDPKILTLPPAMADAEFQQELMRKCRERASMA